MLESSPLKDQNFSRNFKTVCWGLKNLSADPGSTARPEECPVTGISSNLDPAQPIFSYNVKVICIEILKFKVQS